MVWFVFALAIDGNFEEIFEITDGEGVHQSSSAVGKRRLGFGLYDADAGSSSCGDYFSRYSVGHTGFTGTSIWYDPRADLLVVLLSNRVLLGRDREDFKKLRPMIHNWVVEELRRC